MAEAKFLDGQVRGDRMNELKEWLEQKRASIARELEGHCTPELRAYLTTYDQALEAVQNKIATL